MHISTMIKYILSKLLWFSIVNLKEILGKIKINYFKIKLKISHITFNWVIINISI